MSQDTTAGHLEPHVPAEILDGIFARRLNTLRKASGRTQQQLASALSASGNTMHRSTIAKIEAGDRAVSVGEAVQLAGALGVDLAELFTDPDVDAEQERTHRARVDAQVQVRALLYEAAERHKLLEENRILFENTLARLKAAERRLAELGGEAFPASPLTERILAEIQITVTPCSASAASANGEPPAATSRR